MFCALGVWDTWEDTMEFPDDAMTWSKSSYLYGSVESIMNFLRLTLSILICIKIIIIYKIKYMMKFPHQNM